MKNFDKPFGLIIGALIGIFFVAQIVGCESRDIPRQPINWDKYDSAMLADSIATERILDSVNAKAGISRKVETDMKLNQTFDAK